MTSPSVCILADTLLIGYLCLKWTNERSTHRSPIEEQSCVNQWEQCAVAVEDRIDQWQDSVVILMMVQKEWTHGLKEYNLSESSARVCFVGSMYQQKCVYLYIIAIEHILPVQRSDWYTKFL